MTHDKRTNVSRETSSVKRSPFDSELISSRVGTGRRSSPTGYAQCYLRVERARQGSQPIMTRSNEPLPLGGGSVSYTHLALSFQKRYFVANQCRACSRSFASRPKLFRRICRIWPREPASTMRTRDARGASAQLRRRRDRASRGCKRFASAGFRAGSASFSTSWQTVCKHRFSHQAFCVGIGKERLGVAKRRGQNPWS